MDNNFIDQGKALSLFLLDYSDDFQNSFKYQSLNSFKKHQNTLADPLLTSIKTKNNEIKDWSIDNFANFLVTFFDLFNEKCIDVDQNFFKEEKLYPICLALELFSNPFFSHNKIIFSEQQKQKLSSLFNKIHEPFEKEDKYIETKSQMFLYQGPSVSNFNLRSQTQSFNSIQNSMQNSSTNNDLVTALSQLLLNKQTLTDDKFRVQSLRSIKRQYEKLLRANQQVNVAKLYKSANIAPKALKFWHFPSPHIKCPKFYEDYNKLLLKFQSDVIDLTINYNQEKTKVINNKLNEEKEKLHNLFPNSNIPQSCVEISNFADQKTRAGFTQKIWKHQKYIEKQLTEPKSFTFTGQLNLNDDVFELSVSDSDDNPSAKRLSRTKSPKSSLKGNKSNSRTQSRSVSNSRSRSKKQVNFNLQSQNNNNNTNSFNNNQPSNANFYQTKKPNNKIFYNSNQNHNNNNRPNNQFNSNSFNNFNNQNNPNSFNNFKNQNNNYNNSTDQQFHPQPSYRNNKYYPRKYFFKSNSKSYSSSKKYYNIKDSKANFQILASYHQPN